MTNNTELKPCPFCGDEGTVEETHVNLGHGDFETEYWAKCINIMCQASTREIWGCPDDAINHWNTRADKPPVDVEAMIKECNHDARKTDISSKHIEMVIRWVFEESNWAHSQGWLTR